MPTSTLETIGSNFGKAVKAKLSDPAIVGEPEEQLRTPVDKLVVDLASLCGIQPTSVALVGETHLSDLKTRPDFAVSLHGALTGFIELKAPGKGGDPRNYAGHDKAQWDKLQPLPNLIYTDGNEWSLWRSGHLQGDVVRLRGDVRQSGSALGLPIQLQAMFEDFLTWHPTAPRDAKQLAEVTARLCKLLRSEVLEQLEQKNAALTVLAKEWRRLLFPEATDERFADGYAQAVTFGLLMARAREIRLTDGLDHVARQLRESNSLIGTALRLLTDDAENQATLTTSLGTLVRVLDIVDWTQISKGRPDAWLYFYEDFLAEYDNTLRKMTGSYYTPPEVVAAMVRLTHDVLKTHFNRPAGFASAGVHVVDPAVGTGTFPLGVLRKIAEAVEADEGPGAVPQAVNSAIDRLIAFEMQLGPFAVAQLRVVAEIFALAGHAPRQPLRMYVTDTLGNPYVETEELSTLTRAIAESRRMANVVKTTEKITVVIGNPPYKEKAKGKGGWIEDGGSGRDAPLADWMPPANWGVGAHAKHLRNLYVYFWRWATWKVFDQNPAESTGVVCFITVAGFLNGPGFERMRDYLRRKADNVWVIDCSPEGHQPEVNTRLFQGVQQPICIVMVSRSSNARPDAPAMVKYRSLPNGPRTLKFEALDNVKLDSSDWKDCPNGWREPFLPEATGNWATYPKLEDFFIDNSSGVMPGRTWVIAPDAESLIRRWDRLIAAPPDRKELLFHPHQAKGGLGDRHVGKVVAKGLGGRPARVQPLSAERGPCSPPIGYGFRSFDRQWIIPDNRLLNRPNPELWAAHSESQIYLTSLVRSSPSSGPGLTITALTPDLDHYHGRGGRVFPLWQNADATESNVPPGLLALLSKKVKLPVSAEDVFAYVACIAANPAYTDRFKSDLVQPGLRIPVTAKASLFKKAVDIGRMVIWLHTFGDRFADPANGRPPGPPRMSKETAPRIPAGGGIPGDADSMPDEITYDPGTQTLHVGTGRIERVTPAMWAYEVSGKRVLTQWFSYRKKNRARPMIGDRRPPSPLSTIQPDGWPAGYTTELLNVLNVLGRLIGVEDVQAELLDDICSTALVSIDEVAIAVADKASGKVKSEKEKGLFSTP